MKGSASWAWPRNQYHLAESEQVVVQVLARGAVGEPEGLVVKAPEPLSEQLPFAEEGQLLHLDVAHQHLSRRLSALLAFHFTSADSPWAMTIFVSRLYVTALGWVKTGRRPAAEGMRLPDCLMPPKGRRTPAPMQGRFQ